MSDRHPLLTGSADSGRPCPTTYVDAVFTPASGIPDHVFRPEPPTFAALVAKVLAHHTAGRITEGELAGELLELALEAIS